MENLYDYLPLLVLLGISLISSVNKAKKKKQQQRDVSATEEDESEPIFSFPRPVLQPEIVRAPDVVSKPMQKHQQTLGNARKPLTKSHVAESKLPVSSSQPAIVVEDEQNEPFLDASNREEVRRAVIYSEILAPKY